jgi:hypothetical protein
MNRRGVLEAAVFAGTGLLLRYLVERRRKDEELVHLDPQELEGFAGSVDCSPGESPNFTPPELEEFRARGLERVNRYESRGPDRFRTEGQRAGIKKTRSG